MYLKEVSGWGLGGGEGDGRIESVFSVGRGGGVVGWGGVVEGLGVGVGHCEAAGGVRVGLVGWV